MLSLTAPLAELAFFQDAQRKLKKAQSVSISGLSDAQKAHMIAAFSDPYGSRVVLTHSKIAAVRLYEDLLFFEQPAMLLEAKDYIFFQADLSGQDTIRKRLQCYRRILEGGPVTIVTTIDTLMAPLQPLELMQNSTFEAQIGSIVEMAAVSEKLVRMGYEKSDQAREPGQFSVRGGILDVFDMTEENPVRIELWGDEVESIRRFDVYSQRSIQNLEQIRIYPATEMILTGAMKRKGLEAVKKDAEKQAALLKKNGDIESSARILRQAKELSEQIEEFGMMANLDSYMSYFCPETDDFFSLFDDKDLLVIIDEPARAAEHLKAVEAEFRESQVNRLEKGMSLPGQASLLYDEKRVMAMIEKQRLLELSTLGLPSSIGKLKESFGAGGKSIGSFHNSFEVLIGDLKKYHKNKYRTILLSPSATRAKRLAADIFDNDLPAYYKDVDHLPAPGEIMVSCGQISKGFEYPAIGLAVITESDIFGGPKKPHRARKRYEGEKIRSLDQLKPGDYVVHEGHGVGVYRGIEKIERGGVVKDYMKVEYAQGSNLYVPATGFDVIMKYAASDAEKKPKINKLGTQEWEKTTARVKSAVELVAKDLVALYAARNQKKGFEFEKDTVWQKEFEELFPYEETRDQLDAIEATKRDMESSKIMDRLICGDVGFGKTEIAIRAAFKAVQDEKQVAILVPTTILAQQHYETFSQRMKDYPVRVAMLSRFQTTAQNKKTIEDLRKGMVDIVIGTHRLLSADVTFKDLGLLVVDEEQRFGVTHKEKIKQMKDTVDVLTLSATPIPRTLHMGLSGVRDLSVLEEPPIDRMPIQTFVMEENDEMVREAIHREVARGGQVYYVYNRIATIAEAAARIQELAEDVTVAYAHGRMKESQLERIMYDFVQGNIDVLVSTTIIETGLDIPNVNTLIVHDSDQMGLSQLYQLRGRVGRSNRGAYAFLMYKRDKLLREVAEKRLAAIREFTSLGSGIRIAMRDLEIRGAGTMLGKVQHGHLEAVGYDLYLKMLSRAVKAAGNGEEEDTERATATADMDVDAFIPEDYILNEAQKLDIYKRIAAIESREESEDMRSELLDRFGKLPMPVENLLRVALLRQSVTSVFVNEIVGKKDRLTFFMDPRAQIRTENIEFLLDDFHGSLRLQTRGKPAFILELEPKGISPYDEQQLLEAAERLAERMRMRLL
ncbi:MAG: transcription-repair coupling factor [Lachnospiraceae bacterium]|nr:transcription-repair coupling factor [Lachnospiraceae bacterium]